MSLDSIKLFYKMSVYVYQWHINESIRFYLVTQRNIEQKANLLENVGNLSFCLNNNREKKASYIFNFQSIINENNEQVARYW